MTKNEKEQVDRLRREGLGYKKIAQIIGVSDNSVKTYCRRKGKDEVFQEIVAPMPGTVHRECLCCGKEVLQTAGRKEKKFCSDRCRMKWWNSHLDLVKRKAMYEFTCPCCGKQFTAYGNANRKYCSHACYIEDRFGGIRG